MARHRYHDTNDTGGNLTLDSRFLYIPFKFVRTTARRKIAQLLDLENDVINNELQLLTDWRGFAELVRFENLEIRNLEIAKSPTIELLNQWEDKGSRSPTLSDFWTCMLQLNRRDVLLECKEMIERDAMNHIEINERLEKDAVQVPIVGSTTDDPSNYHHTDHLVNERIMLTRHDVENPGNPIIYDAFLCYNQDSSQREIQFVKDCVKQLEHKYNLKLCIPERDCLAGGARYIVDAELIKSRCRRIIVVVSDGFVRSAECDFRLKFAHSLNPAARKNRIIPVLLDERLVMPDILRHITVCDYTKPDLMEWFWGRLAASLNNPLEDEIGLDIVAQRRPQEMEIQNYPASSRKENDSTAKRFFSRIHSLVGK